MKPSALQFDRIYRGWMRGMSPLECAKRLRLVPMTVIREYVRLDEAHGHPWH